MARPSGSRNRDYEPERARLALALARCLIAGGGAPLSAREMAAGIGVSVPTLVHYFGSRDGAWRAAIETIGRMGDAAIERAATEDHGPPGPSTRWFLESFVQAWTRHGVGAMFGTGLALGMRSSQAGPGFINGILEPSLQAAERRLARHVERGEIPPMDLRAAALALLSPVVLALIHQGPLGGDRCRPLDIDALIDVHHVAWLRGWASFRESEGS